MTTTLENGLSFKEVAFVNAYVDTGSAIKAYRAARYGHKGQGDSAYTCASEILRRPKVQEAINKRANELDQLAKKEMASEWLKTRQVRRDIAYSSLDDVIDPSGEVPKSKDWRKIPKRAKRALKKVKINLAKDGSAESVEYEMRDPAPHLNALEERYSVMPDNERPAVKVDITIDSVDGRRKAVMELMNALKTRAESKMLNGLNGAMGVNGSSNGEHK